jgi:hypothetical protein
MWSGLTEISVKAQVFKSNNFICNVIAHYFQVGDPEREVIRTRGELLIEESKRNSPEVLNDIRHIPVKLCMENGETIEIVVFKGDGDQFDGKFWWVPWANGKLSSLKQL